MVSWKSIMSESLVFQIFTSVSVKSVDSCLIVPQNALVFIRTQEFLVKFPFAKRKV